MCLQKKTALVILAALQNNAQPIRLKIKLLPIPTNRDSRYPKVFGAKFDAFFLTGGSETEIKCQ